ncbi:MAG: alpha-ketoglutarate-dependent dioxygenase AlkB [Herminiimonas sp.]|nr:alpha-ketoglutarate-dependent dioxygenase AlkB [Herminiimonas sp.]
MRGFYAPPMSHEIAELMLRDTAWQQEKITVWNKQHWQPRLTCWYGDARSRYTYSGIALTPNQWTPTLLKIKQDVEQATGTGFNSVLLNLYRDQNDSVGMHSDDERELGGAPVIASVSFGETRTFRLKHKTRKDLKPISIELTDGSLLLMAGDMQKHWLHGIDKARQVKSPRINLTFRTIYPG